MFEYLAEMFSLLRRLSGLLHRPSSAAPADDDTPGGSRKGVTGDSESVYSEEKVVISLPSAVY